MKDRKSTLAAAALVVTVGSWLSSAALGADAQLVMMLGGDPALEPASSPDNTYCPPGSQLNLADMKAECVKRGGTEATLQDLLDAAERSGSPDTKRVWYYTPTAQKQDCPRDSEHSAGGCYRCPPWTTRTAEPVDRAGACRLADFWPALRRERANDRRKPACPEGQFRHARDRTCYECPPGMSRTKLPVYSEQACAAGSTTERDVDAELVCGAGRWIIHKATLGSSSPLACFRECAAGFKMQASGRYFTCVATGTREAVPPLDQARAEAVLEMVRLGTVAR